MAVDWPTLSLGEAGVSLFDCEHITPPDAGTGYPWIAIPEMKDGRIDVSKARRISHDDWLQWTRRVRPRPGDVILSRRCNPGESVVVPPGLDCALGQNLVILRSDEKILRQDFLRWLVRSPAWWEQVKRYLNVGAVFDSLRCADIPQFRLPIPPLAKQEAIARTLSALDDKIALNADMNQTLEAMARVLFRAWFVDFEPVRAKEEGRPTGLPIGVAVLFPNRLVQSSFGPIPEGWKVQKLSDLVTLKSDRVDPTPSKDLEPYIAIDHMPRKSLSLSTWGTGKEVNSSIIRFQRGDILFASMRPYFHKVVIAPFDGITRTTTFVLRPQRSQEAIFAAMLCSSADVVEKATSASVGTTIPYVRWEAMSQFPYVHPNSPVIDAFHRIVSPLIQRIEVNNQESRVLAQLRDRLLPKLLDRTLHFSARIPEVVA